MTSATTTKTLVDEIAAHLEQVGPSSCADLARALRRRKAHVLEALRHDPSFERRGSGRGSRWALTSNDPREHMPETQGTIPSPNPSRYLSERGEGHTALRFAPRKSSNAATIAIEGLDSRVAVLEARLLPPPRYEPPPITFKQWAGSEGGEDALHRYEADRAAFWSGEATSEQIERMRFAYAEETTGATT